MKPQELAEAYLKNYRSGLDEDFWAFEEVNEACNNFETGLEITLALISATTNDQELSYVAAGPVEDMLNMHGTKAMEAFEKAATHSKKTLEALAGVWLSESNEAYSSWKQLMNKHNLINC